MKSSFASTKVNILPFTGGLIFPIYAFFWPVSFGTWLGVMVHAFRSAAGF